MKYFKYLIIILFIFNFNFSFAKDDNLKTKITKNLRCLICQGQSIHDSDSEFANSLKILVDRKLEEGFTEKQIPSFTTKLFNSNNEINSDEIFKNDKYYLMNVWSSWCVPCRDEHQYLMELNTEKNLEIIGLNYKDNILNAKKFLDELKNPYSNIISDLNGLIAIEWGAYGVPESFLIYNKSIIKKVVGPLNENLVFEIKEMIK